MCFTHIWKVKVYIIVYIYIHYIYILYMIIYSNPPGWLLSSHIYDYSVTCVMFWNNSSELAYPPPAGTFQDDVPFSKAESVSSLERTLIHTHTYISHTYICIYTTYCRGVYRLIIPNNTWQVHHLGHDKCTISAISRGVRNGVFE